MVRKYRQSDKQSCDKEVRKHSATKINKGRKFREFTPHKSGILEKPFEVATRLPTFGVYSFIAMKRYHLGEFEELVVLAIGILNNKAYSVTIKDEIEERTARTVSLGALHTALKRMEDKGYLRSFPGDSNDERGGRPKRYFEITALGKKAVQHSRDTRAEFWNAVPKTILQSNLAVR